MWACLQDRTTCPKTFKSLFKTLCVSSEAEENFHENSKPVNDFDLDWNRYIGPDSILEGYDTVIEIYSGDTHFSPDESSLEQYDTDYIALNDDSIDERTVEPGWHYESRSDSIEAINERLERETLVLAFGHAGSDLPNYTELSEGLNSDGNWWDHPEDVYADFLVDKDTYEGAFKTPRTASVQAHFLRGENGLTDVMHVSQSNP